MINPLLQVESGSGVNRTGSRHAKKSLDPNGAGSRPLELGKMIFELVVYHLSLEESKLLMQPCLHGQLAVTSGLQTYVRN